jgi:lauroyl/myristoyl acyltransferase
LNATDLPMTARPSQPGALVRTAFRFAPNVTRRVLPTLKQWASIGAQRHWNHASRQVMRAIGVQSPAVYREAALLPHRLMADTLFLRHAPLPALTALPRIIHGMPALEALDARREGRGVLFACANLGCFYLSLTAHPSWIDDVLVITPNVPPPEERLLCDRLEAWSGLHVELTAATRQSAVAIARRLGQGGAVATMLDAHLPDTPFLTAPFFGRPAATPRGIYEIAVKQQALVVPAYNVCVDGTFHLFFDDAIDSRGRDAAAVAAEVNRHFETVIRRHPGQWRLWATLPQRWSQAAATSLGAKRGA